MARHQGSETTLFVRCYASGHRFRFEGKKGGSAMLALRVVPGMAL